MNIGGRQQRVGRGTELGIRLTLEKFVQPHSFLLSSLAREALSGWQEYREGLVDIFW